MDYRNISQQCVNGGLNLRDAPDKLQEGQWRRLTNIRSISEGSITSRPGRQWVAGTNNGDDVHTLFRLNDVVISGSGTSLLRNNDPYPSTWSGRPISWVKHRATQGDEKWGYLSDGFTQRMIGSDGSEIVWGITAPTQIAAFSQSAQTGNLDSSVAGAIVYDWRYTYFNARTGGESNPSPTADGISVVGRKANIVLLSSLDGQVDSVKVYRRGGVNGGDVWRFTGAAPNPGADPNTGQPQAIHFVDNNSDEAISLADSLRLDNDVPFTSKDQNGDALYNTALPFVWGPLNGEYIFACGDPNRPGEVYWTNRGRPHSSGATNHIAVTGPDEPLVGGFMYGGQSFCWTRENLYALDFNGPEALPTFLPRRTFCGRGLSVPFAFTVGPLIWFFSKDGVYATDGASPAEPLTEGTIRPLFNPQVKDGGYIAPGTIAQIAWPPYTLEDLSTTRSPSEVQPRDFTVTASSSSVSLTVGSTATLTITVAAATGQFWNNVDLSIPVLPAGVTYSFNPPTGVPGFGSYSSTLTLTAASSMTAGSFSFQVKAKRSGGSLTHLTTPIALTVSGSGTATSTYTFALSPSLQSVAKGTDTTVNLAITSGGSFNSSVALAVGTLPTGVTVSLSSSSVTPAAGQTSTVVATISATDNTATVGSYSIDFTATSGTTVKTSTLTLSVVASPGEPVPLELGVTILRMNYGGQYLHVHYKDILGQWVHMVHHLPYGRWSNDESPEVEALGGVFETLSYFDETQVNTALLIGTNTGQVALETGTYDYTPGGQIQCRARTGSIDFGIPQTLKEFGNMIIDAECNDAVLPLSIDPAQPAGISVIPFLSAESQMLNFQRISGTGRQKFPLSFRLANGGEEPYGYSVALDFEWNGNATVYAFDILFHPDEEILTRWEFPPTSHGLRGYQQVRDVYVVLRSTGSVTPTVEIDGEVYPLYTQTGASSIPSTSGTKSKVHLWAPAVKGKVYRWMLTGGPFRTYGNEAEVRVKEIASGLGYQLINPFQGSTANV